MKIILVIALLFIMGCTQITENRRMHSQLYAHIQNLNMDEFVDIGIWAKCESPPVTRDMPEEESRKILQDTSSKCKKPIIDFIESKGYEITSDSQYNPLFYTRLPKNIILELNNRDDISIIDLNAPQQPG